MDYNTIIIITSLALIYVIFRIINDIKKSIANNQKIKNIAKETSIPENDRRIKIAQILANEGYIVTNSCEGLIQYYKQKPSFSFILFIILLLIWVLPGILYLIYKAMQKEKPQKIIIDVA